MPDDIMTLKELLDADEVTADLYSPLVAAMRSNEALADTALLRPMMAEARRALAEALNISLGDILTSAWIKAGEVQKAADPMHHPPDELVQVRLLEHTIRYRQEPELDLTLNGKKVHSLKFTVELAVQLSGVILSIRASRIREVEGGKGAATATLSIGEAKLAERTTPDIALPLCIKLGEGIPIPVPHRHQMEVSG
jgi:hypothetical protein